MTLVVVGEVAQRVPIRTDGDGAIRVGGTRVPLEAIVHAHRQGDSPEAIQASYGTLQLADIYAVIAFYLSHQAQVDQYIAEREQQADSLQARLEADPRLSAFRAQLRRRKAQYEAATSDLLRR